MPTYDITCTVQGTTPDFTLDLTHTGTQDSAADITVEQTTVITWRIENSGGEAAVITQIEDKSTIDIFNIQNGGVEPAPVDGNQSVWSGTVETLPAGTKTASETYCIHFKVGDTVCNHDPVIKIEEPE